MRSSGNLLLNSSLEFKLDRWVVLLLIIVFAAEKWVVQPHVKAIYLHEDESAFVASLFFPYLIITAIVAIVVTIYCLIKGLIKSDLLPQSIFLTVMLLFLLKSTTDNLLLGLNSLLSTEKYTLSYTVKIYNTGTYFLLIDEKDRDFIWKSEWKKIDSFRLEKGQESVYKLKNLDTIQVKFAKGIFNVNFLD